MSSAYTKLTSNNETYLRNYVENGGWTTASLVYAKIGQINQSFMETSSGSSIVSHTSEAFEASGPAAGYLDASFGNLVFSNSAAQNLQILIQQNVRQILQATGTAYIDPFTAQLSTFGNTDSLGQLLEDFGSAITSLDLSGLDMIRLLLLVFNLNELERMLATKSLDPMIALQTLGFDITNKSVTLFSWAFVAVIGTAVPFAGPAIGFFISIAMTIALVGFGVGFLLFYLLPIFPFMFFCFAVIAWVMEIFEAIIGMPLWALGHLRIDGEGYAGQGALTGYLLLFAILTRPLFIVFGLIGGYIIFGASTHFLQTLYIEIIHMQTGSSFISISGLIYMLIYAYLVYQIAMMSFKMVDTVPQQILRWMGQSAQTFNDQRKDVVGDSTNFILGSTAIANQIQGAVK